MSQAIFLLLGAIAIAATVSAQACGYYANNFQCIKAEAEASTTIPFAPLLPTPPTFVCAIDEPDADDIKTQEEKERFSILSSATYNGAILKVACGCNTTTAPSTSPSLRTGSTMPLRSRPTRPTQSVGAPTGARASWGASASGTSRTPSRCARLARPSSSWAWDRP